MIEALEERVARYSPERYPVQHATAQFHLGVALASAGRTDEAERALRTAVALFDRDKLPVEHAKALNALGAVLRDAGRLDDAERVLQAAAETFAAAERELEQGAAVFNLGLVHRAAGDVEAAIASFTRATELLRTRGGPAARELGMLWLEHGDISAAIATLERALELDDDEPGRGAAANALGLALLAEGRTGEAVTAFRDALAANPRTLRPTQYAMVKANLALAYERAHDAPRARLAARQALIAAETPEPVAEQARAVLDRLGPVTDDVAVVLQSEADDRWAAILREEVLHWTETDARAFFGAQPSPELVEAWLGALLELPPEEMTAAIASTRRVLTAEDEALVRSVVPRFHQPQMLRLEAAFGWSSPAT